MTQKNYFVNISVGKCLDIIIPAESKEEAERLAKDNWEEYKVELDYGTEVEVISCDVDEFDEED